MYTGSYYITIPKLDYQCLTASRRIFISSVAMISPEQWNFSTSMLISPIVTAGIQAEMNYWNLWHCEK